MITIHKYKLELDSPQELELPERHKILSVGIDPNGDLCIWVLVDIDLKDSNKTKREFLIFGTGHDIPRDMMPALNRSKFLGTVLYQNTFMWHVYVKEIN